METSFGTHCTKQPFDWLGDGRNVASDRAPGGQLPRISEFFGIVVSMYYNDHQPPHFHARYAEHEVEIRLGSLQILRGSLPTSRLALVVTWAHLHADELAANWEAARRGDPLSGIPGLE